MIHYISEKLAHLTVEKSCNSEEKVTVLSYGYELIIGQLFASIIILLIGSIVGLGWEMLLFLISFACLRLFCGGFHANTYRNCFISSVIIAFLVVCLGSVMGRYQIFWLSFLTVIIASFILFLKGPFINPKHPISQARVLINWRKGRILILTEDLCVLTLLFFQQFVAAYILTFSEMAVAILLILAHIQKRKEERTYV